MEGDREREEASQWTGFELGLGQDREEADVMTVLAPVVNRGAPQASADIGPFSPPVTQGSRSHCPCSQKEVLKHDGAITCPQSPGW